VFAEEHTEEPLVLEWLSAAEDAYRLLVGALELPEPAWGPRARSRVDLYITRTSRRAEAFYDSPWLESDRSSGYCLVPEEPMNAKRDALDCIAHAIGFGLDVAETPHARQSYAALLSRAALGPSAEDQASLDRLQQNTHLSLAPRQAGEPFRASPLLFEYTERSLASAPPGEVITSLLSLSRSDTPSEGPRFDNEPDWLDVLRRSVGEQPSDLARWLGQFAMSRALLGRERVPRGPLQFSDFDGEWARARYEWRLPFSSLPRRVAPLRPIEPLGTTFIWVDLDTITLGATLGFRAEWEPPAAFQWMLVAIDGDGREMTRLEIPFVEGAHRAEKTWVNFEAARAVIVVGVNLGGVDASHPFDPDYEPWEPHGYTVYLAKL
jgi:hypothetical protein